MAYTTRALIKSRLGIGETTTHDTLIDNWILRASSLVDAETGRSFEATTATKYFTPLKQTFGGHLSEDGRTLLLAPHDLLTITTLTNGDSAVISSSEYVLLPPNIAPYYGIRLKLTSTINWTYTTNPENAISIAGTWGYAATAPNGVIEAVEQAIVYWYKTFQAGGNSGQAMQSSDGVYLTAPRLPRDVDQLLCPYRKRL